MTERDASATEAAPDPAVADANAAAEAFIGKWRGVPASELSTSQSFLLDLCALLGVALLLPDHAEWFLYGAVAVSLVGVAAEFWHGRDYFLDKRIRDRALREAAVHQPESQLT